MIAACRVTSWLSMTAPCIDPGFQKRAAAARLQGAIERVHIRGQDHVIELHIGLQQRPCNGNADGAAEIAHQAINAGGLRPQRRWQRREGEDVDRNGEEADAEALDEAYGDHTLASHGATIAASGTATFVGPITSAVLRPRIRLCA
jgi:hypothetical protein